MIDPSSPSRPARLQAPHQLWRSIALLAMAGITAAICLSGGELEKGTVAGVRLDLPAIVGGYYGERQDITLAERTMLPLDTEFARRLYHSFDGESINCQIVLSGGEKRSIHRPEVCLPGQGWTIRSGMPVEIELPGRSPMTAMRLDLSRSVERADGSRFELQSVFLYWFVGADKTTAHHWHRILLSSWDRVVHGVHHRWAYVIVSATATQGLQPNGRDVEATFTMLKDFVREMYPHIHTDNVAPSSL